MIDFLVIGGGIAGVSAAAELASLGTVRVLEAESGLGHHASGRSAAMFLAGYGNQTVQALNHASAPDHHTAGVLSPRGFLLVAGAGKEAEYSAACSAFCAAPVSPAEAADLWPILDTETCVQAAYRPDVFDLDTDRLLQGFARTARRRGATISTGARVLRIDRVGRAWHVATTHETMEARRLVNAAGAWADDLASLAGVAPLGIRPFRRSMACLPAPGGLDTRSWPFVDEVTEAWYAKPDAGAILVSPAEEHPVEPHDAFADDMVIAEGLDRYQRFVTEPVTRVTATWAGLRSFAPDRALVLGPDPAIPAFLWCAGQGGYGFQTAPAAARLLADLAAGRRPELDPETVRALRPNRLVG